MRPSVQRTASYGKDSRSAIPSGTGGGGGEGRTLGGGQERTEKMVRDERWDGTDGGREDGRRTLTRPHTHSLTRKCTLLQRRMVPRPGTGQWKGSTAGDEGIEEEDVGTEGLRYCNRGCENRQLLCSGCTLQGQGEGGRVHGIGRWANECSVMCVDVVVTPISPILPVPPSIPFHSFLLANRSQLPSPPFCSFLSLANNTFHLLHRPLIRRGSLP